MMKLIVAFRKLANAPKNNSFSYIRLYEIYSSFWCEEISLEACPIILDTSCLSYPQIYSTNQTRAGKYHFKQKKNILSLFDGILTFGPETGPITPSIAAVKNKWIVASTRIFMACTWTRLPLPLFCVFRARNVYVCGLVLDSLGMLLMALTRHRYAVIVFSAAAGVMYSTLFTVPYLLVAHYHASRTVSDGLEWYISSRNGFLHSIAHYLRVNYWGHFHCF